MPATSRWQGNLGGQCLKSELQNNQSQRVTKIRDGKTQQLLLCLSIITPSLSCTGFYAYIETSSPRRAGDNARLEFKPSLAAGTSTCITFYYHMFGRDVGELKVYVNDKQAFSKTKKEGDKWIRGTFKFPERAKTVSTHVEFIVFLIHINRLSSSLEVPFRCLPRKG